MPTSPATGFTIALTVALLGTSTAHAALTTASCLATKRQAHGKLAQCRATEEAKGLKAKPADLVKCTTTFLEKLAKLGAKATKAGVACRYRDNGDGTVTDYDTGLQWEQKSGGGGGQNHADPHDVDNGYSWTTSGSAADGPAFGEFLSQLNACSFASGFFGSSGFAGHCDWRVPELAELQSIVQQPCPADPCLDPIFGPVGALSYWTSTTLASSSFYAWRIFGENTDFSLKGGPLHVRAVRRAF